MTRSPLTPDCAIKGCAYAAHKGYLCRKHYALVPRQMVVDCMFSSISAQVVTANKHHKRQLAYVRKQLAA